MTFSWRIKATRDNWLILSADIGTEKYDSLSFHPRGDLTAAQAESALAAQYGLGKYRCWEHGQAMGITTTEIWAKWGRKS